MKTADKSQTWKEPIERMLAEIEKRRKTYARHAGPEEWLETLLRDTLDPKPAPIAAVPQIPRPTVVPEYPHLRVLYDAKTGAAKEWVIVQKPGEVTHFVSWFKCPMEELETLKRDCVPEYYANRPDNFLARMEAEKEKN